MITRRNMLGGLAGMFVASQASAIVTASNLMRIRPASLDHWGLSWFIPVRPNYQDPFKGDFWKWSEMDELTMKKMRAMGIRCDLLPRPFEISVVPASWLPENDPTLFGLRR